MSIRRWLKPATVEENEDPTLPRAEGNSSTAAANKEVARVLKKRKRGEYHKYDPEVRVKIAKHACENGNKSTVLHFSRKLGFSVSEGTVRNFKRTLSELKAGRDPDSIVSFPNRSIGRPLLIGDFDQEVFQYIKQLRAAGGVVNRNIIVAAARGIISHKKPSLLKEFGGTLDLSRKWAESFLQHRGFVRRKATKAARKLPPDYPELKAAFLKRIEDEVKTHDIPPNCI